MPSLSNGEAPTDVIAPFILHLSILLPHMPKRSQAVLFDMDGVITLTEEPHFQSWQVPAKRRGFSIDHGLFLSCFGRTNADCVPILFPGVAPGEVAAIADEKETAFREIIADDVPLAPGLIELLEELTAAGVCLGVGSSAPPENVNLVLDNGRIRKFFGAVVTGADVKIGKPDPTVFLMGAKSLGVEPAHAAVLEDAPPGIQAARNGGMLAVGLTTTHTADQLTQAGAHLLFPSIQALRGGQLLSHLTKLP